MAPPGLVVRQWWTQSTPIGHITVVMTARGVESISFDGDRARDVPVDAEPARDSAIAAQLDEWFAGDRRVLDLALDLEHVHGFRRDVLDTLRNEVGWGETVSYGELAEMAGRPGAARAVGTIMAGNPVPFVIPCHRVIASGGRIGGYGGSSRGESASLAIKRRLLSREGVTVKG
jgi:methylated-DNA-[protein]-cysteine S-methyltransferase